MCGSLFKRSWSYEVVMYSVGCYGVGLFTLFKLIQCIYKHIMIFEYVLINSTCKLQRIWNTLYSYYIPSQITLVVHSMDVKDCEGTPQRRFTLKPAKIPYIMIWQYWLGNTKPKKAFRLILNALKKLLQNFKKII